MLKPYLTTTALLVRISKANLPYSNLKDLINWIVKIIKGIFIRSNSIIRQTRTMLQTNLPTTFFLGKHITTNAMLAFIYVHVFCSHADLFVCLYITDLFPALISKNLTLYLTLHFNQFGHHLPIILNAVFKRGTFIVNHNH